MRMSQLFSQTLRDIPSEADTPGHQYLLRAGYVRQLSAGIYSYLPLARRVLSKIEAILRQEMNKIHGQEITMPVVHPAELWKETGRWYQIGSEMGRFKDKNNRDMVLAMTHEEVVADLVRHEIRSYRQLPQLIYHLQTKWRDDPRPRAGLIRVREFTMKDSYSLDADWEGLKKQYHAHYQAYFNIFRRCGLPVTAVRSDSGMMGGNIAHEFMYLTPYGEDTLLLCDHCGYSANRQIARHYKLPGNHDEPLPNKLVATPESKTIDALAAFLKIPKAKTAKAILLMATLMEGTEKVQRFVFAVVRGDTDLNETKLANAIHAIDLRPACEEEIRTSGAVPGYASPVGLSDTLIVIDDLIAQSTNLAAGANREGYHLLNVNYPRDFSAEIVTDLTTAYAGDGCPQCKHPLRSERGVEVGNIFQLGTRYSDAMGCYFLAQDGSTKPVIMGSYGIGVGRLLACIAEQYNDEHGFIWPVTVTPYHVHLISLASKARQPGFDPSGAASQLYADLLSQGIEVLFDDRNESPGVKFADADLVGIPLRITVSDRAFQQGGVEFKRRDQPDKIIVPFHQVSTFVQEQISALHTQIMETLVDETIDN